MEWRYRLVMTLMMIMVMIIVVMSEHDFPMQGDSGGSVMHLEGRNYESIGIVSWGVEGCQVN